MLAMTTHIFSALPKIVFGVIDEFPGYLFGADGTGWSQRGRFAANWKARGLWRRLKPGKRGRYKCFDLHRANGSHCKVGVHVAVCTAFHGPRPRGLVACHKNGDRDDNRARNLRWATHKRNEADKLRHGRRIRGSQQWASKLTEADVKRMRKLRARGVSLRKLARRFGVTYGNVTLVVQRKSWAWVA
jgi:hypothetical protein